MDGKGPILRLESFKDMKSDFAGFVDEQVITKGDVGLIWLIL